MDAEKDEADGPRTSTSVSRGWSNLHLPTWLGLMVASTTVRSTLSHPLHVVLVRKRISAERHPPTLLSMLRLIYRGDGAKPTIRNLYRGFGAAAFGNGLGEVSYLMTLEFGRDRLLDVVPMTATRDAVSAAIADLIAIVLCTPLSVICTRQMTAGYGMAKDMPYANSAATTRQIWSAAADGSVWGGVRGLYAGFSAGLVKVPASALWWASYGQLKVLLYGAAERTWGRDDEGTRQLVGTNWFASTSDNPLINGAAGIAASALTTVVYNPVTVVETRLQSLDPAQHRKGWRVVGIARDLVRHEGWRGFYKGTYVNVGVAVIDGLLFSFMYELTKLGSDKDVTVGG